MKSDLRSIWRDQQGCVGPAQDGAERVEQLEAHYQLTLPEDFALYLRELAPPFDWMDNHGVIWWGTGRIKTLLDECGVSNEEQSGSVTALQPAQYLVFADFLDWCNAYAICSGAGEDRGKVARISAEPDEFVADSFSHFVFLVRTDSPLIHPPAPPVGKLSVFQRVRNFFRVGP